MLRHDGDLTWYARKADTPRARLLLSSGSPVSLICRRPGFRGIQWLKWVRIASSAYPSSSFDEDITQSTSLPCTDQRRFHTASVGSSRPQLRAVNNARCIGKQCSGIDHVSYWLDDLPVTSLLYRTHDGSVRFTSTGAAFLPVVCTGCAVNSGSAVVGTALQFARRAERWGEPD